MLYSGCFVGVNPSKTTYKNISYCHDWVCCIQREVKNTGISYDAKLKLSLFCWQYCCSTESVSLMSVWLDSWVK